MKKLSHSTSPLIKECTPNLLKDQTRFSSNMRTKNGEDRNFKSMRKIVLAAYNTFLEEVKYTSDGYNRHVDSQNGGRTDKLSGFSMILKLLEFWKPRITIKLIWCRQLLVQSLTEAMALKKRQERCRTCVM